MAFVLHIDTPCCTPEEFGRRVGLSTDAVLAKVHKGELPTMKLALTPGKRERVMVNMIAIAKMADAAEFNHPSYPQNGG